MRDQWLVWGRRLQVAGLAAALGAAVLWVGSPAGAVNDIVVDPTTNLHDGQVVQVTLNNWDFSLSSVDLMQCNPGAQQLADCAVAETQIPFPIQDSTGTGSYTVKLLTGLVNCDRTHPCALVAVSDATNFVGNSREVQLTFADDAPSTTTTTGASTTSTTTGGSTTSTTGGGSTTSTSGSSTTTTTGGSSSSTTSTSTTGSSTTTTTSVTATRGEATPSDPVATKVSSPVPGQVQITESKTTTTPAPAGFTLIGAEVRITGPTSTAAAPLKLEFRLDGSLLGGRDETSLVVLRNGVTVSACTGAPQAIPDPCVSSRARSGDDAVLTVLASQASTWNFALSAAGTPTGSATTVTSSPSLPFQATGTTLPRTGLETQMLWLLAIGVVLAGAGSLVRRHALAVV